MKEQLKNFYLKTPDELLEVIKKWFTDEKRIAFITTLIVGFITHVVLLAIIILSPDGLWNGIRYSAGMVETTSGRWAINIIDSLRKNIAVPTITTTISILVTAVIAVFIVDFFELKSKFSIVIVSSFLAVSPTLALTLLYAYTADAYTYAFLFAVLAVWCMYEEKYKIFNYILSVILVMFTMALYQSYLGAIIVLCIMKPIIGLLKGRNDYKKLFIKIGISILIVAVGIGLYYVTEQMALKLYGTSLSSYGGANEISIKNVIKNLPFSVKMSYLDFFNFFLGNDIVWNSNMWRNRFYAILFLIETISILIILVYRKTEDRKKKIIDNILIIVAMLLIPIGANIIIIIAPTTNFYALNSGQLILMIPFFMLIFEEYKFRRGVILKYGMVIMCLIIGVTYYLADNASYCYVRLKYNQSYAMALRMVDKIENAEGYDASKPWAIVGIVDDGNSAVVTDLCFLTYGSFVNGPIFHGNYWGSNETWRKFLQLYLGIQPNLASPEQYYEVCGTNEFIEMTIFPNPGSVREINGVMVVKFTDTVPM